MDAETPKSTRGVAGKPLIEQIKLLFVFVLIGIAIYLSRPTPISFTIGAVLVTIGTVIRVWAGGHLTRDQKLTTSGPYQYTRNPFYLGRLLLIIGFGVMSGLGATSGTTGIAMWVLFIMALVIFFGLYMPRKELREGGRLRQMFGKDYETWKANVPSLFPRLTPYKMNPRPWSRDLYLGGDANFSGNKELWTTITIMFLVALFYLRMLRP